MTGDCTVQVRFHLPPAELRRYFTSFYITEIDVAGAGTVTDQLHPEWANLRIAQGVLPEGRLVGQQPFGPTRAIFAGPTSTSVHFVAGTSRIWGIGLLPLGWARFAGVPAADFADKVFDFEREPSLHAFRPLAESLFGPEPDEAGELARITAHFAQRDQGTLSDDARITACHGALVDPDVSTVAEMAEAANLAQYTVERLCRRHFGFTPSLLLRRQRFMRSLAQYMLDPSLKWIGAMDGHYHDQAQFVRDFHRFMGMSPREYGATPHPVLAAVMRARQEAAGAAVQALHHPLLAVPATR